MEHFGTYVELMSRLEALVRRVVSGRFHVAGDLWQIQLDLLTLLGDAAEETGKLHRLHENACLKEQTVISAKQHAWRTAAQEWQEQKRILQRRIQSLTEVRERTRSAGDALAWLLFEGDERLLRPLSENSRAGSVPDEHARIGLLVIAQELAGKGAGFPILHDITNILRVGDITFLKPGQEPITVEVKSHSSIDPDDSDARRYSVQVWGNEDQMRPFVAPRAAQTPERPATEPTKRIAKNDRLLRQLKRMGLAHQLQNANSDQLFNHGDVPTLLTSWSRDETMHHWTIARQLASRAKANGSASSTADGAVFYAALYSETPIHLCSKDELPADWFQATTRELGKCDIFYSPPNTDRNALWFGTSLSYDHDLVALNHLPFLLYPLDQEHIEDMLWGRLWFFVCLNVGKIVEYLEQLGLHARYPENRSHVRHEFLRISTNVTLPSGENSVVELRNTAMFGGKLLYEFLSLEGFGKLIESIARSSEEAIRNVHSVNPDIIHSTES